MGVGLTVWGSGILNQYIGYSIICYKRQRKVFTYCQFFYKGFNHIGDKV